MKTRNKHKPFHHDDHDDDNEKINIIRSKEKIDEDRHRFELEKNQFIIERNDFIDEKEYFSISHINFMIEKEQFEKEKQKYNKDNKKERENLTYLQKKIDESLQDINRLTIKYQLEQSAFMQDKCTFEHMKSKWEEEMEYVVRQQIEFSKQQIEFSQKQMEYTDKLEKLEKLSEHLEHKEKLLQEKQEQINNDRIQLDEYMNKIVHDLFMQPETDAIIIDTMEEKVENNLEQKDESEKTKQQEHPDKSVQDNTSTTIEHYKKISKKNCIIS